MNVKTVNLAALAKDVVDCKVFGSWQIPKRDEGMIGSIFMPMMFGDKGLFDGVAHLYEYYAEAGPMSINGYPIFWSCGTISTKDWPVFVDHLIRAEVRLAKADLIASVEGGNGSWIAKVAAKLTIHAQFVQGSINRAARKLWRNLSNRFTTKGATP